jgi:hypothetical protein
MDELLVRRIVAAKYDEYAKRVIWRFKRLGPEARQSGDDSPYKNVWEEYVSQVQGQESIYFPLYEATLQRTCAAVLSKLRDAELQLLWLGTEAYIEWEDDGFPLRSRLDDDVTAKLYSTVWGIAADEELRVDDVGTDDEW